MAKQKSRFVCQSCGGVHSRWQGRCDACGSWNSLEAESASPGPPGAVVGGGDRRMPLVSLAGDSAPMPRLTVGIGELDRVTGGGFVPGSAVLVGGDPGIGKSTLLVQAAAALAKRGRKVLYVSGEEAVAQVRLRAERLGVSDAPVALASETNVETILATLQEQAHTDFVVLDSIQTLWSQRIEAAPGTVSQIRTCSQALIREAKRSGASMIFVGHVTKDGQIAGPRVVEHMVDAVLYFEGDSGHQFRIMRAVKNRFGATDEIGVFEMSDRGLAEVANPSELFLGDRDSSSPGAAVFAGIEGTRPILVEIQALLAPTSFGTPRRAVVGWDQSRLSMLLAVLEARCGVPLGTFDVYLNVAGGMRINEPGADLAVAAAILSALSGVANAPDNVYFGEVSLSGAVRGVSQSPARLKEAEKLGFKTAYLPGKNAENKGAAVDRHPVWSLGDLVAAIVPDRSPAEIAQPASWPMADEHVV